MFAIAEACLPLYYTALEKDDFDWNCRRLFIVLGWMGVWSIKYRMTEDFDNNVFLQRFPFKVIACIQNPNFIFIDIDGNKVLRNVMSVTMSTECTSLYGPIQILIMNCKTKPIKRKWHHLTTFLVSHSEIQHFKFWGNTLVFILLHVALLILLMLLQFDSKVIASIKLIIYNLQVIQGNVNHFFIWLFLNIIYNRQSRSWIIFSARVNVFVSSIIKALISQQYLE